jgi:hypothetical protein
VPPLIASVSGGAAAARDEHIASNGGRNGPIGAVRNEARASAQKIAQVCCRSRSTRVAAPGAPSSQQPGAAMTMSAHDPRPWSLKTCDRAGDHPTRL